MVVDDQLLQYLEIYSGTWPAHARPKEYFKDV